MILVDSDVLIAHLRGVVAARDWLVSARKDGPLAISVVSTAELIGGMRTPNGARCGACLHRFGYSQQPR